MSQEEESHLEEEKREEKSAGQLGSRGQKGFSIQGSAKRTGEAKTRPN